MSYKEFLDKKELTEEKVGFEYDKLPSKLFGFQNMITKWALKRGKAAVFADTGLGKSFMQVSWADAVVKKTNKQVLVLAPLCVAEQTVSEAEKLNIKVDYRREYDKDSKIIITNYEMLGAFEDKIKEGVFSGIVIDESSILKHQDSKTRNKIISLSQNIPYRLSCTATPSPNDHMELGSQAEFLGLMDYSEMLSLFFTHDGSETQKWILKGHAKDRFWEWVSSWAVYIKKPSDIGFLDDDYDLPKLNNNYVNIGLFADYNLNGLKGRHKAKQGTVKERVEACAEIVNSSKEAHIVWCNRNDESKELKKLISDSVEVTGSDSVDEKKLKIMAFTNGDVKVLITKPKIAGFGMNWQHCHNMTFVGLTDSYEQTYQAIRRCYRFGQEKEVNVNFIVHSKENVILQNIKRKEKQNDEMSREIVKFMGEFQNKEVHNLIKEKAEYKLSKKEGDGFELYLGDCVEVTKKLKDESVDYSVFSPPFANLYVYSNSDRDMGNNSYDQFWEHFDFFIPELFRILRNGRNVSVHCMNLPTSKQRDGYIGLKDFRGDIIRAFQKHGFIYQSEVTVWKDPVVAMQRTKALGLLWKQIKKDSSMNRQGLPDYVVTFRKPGENTKPITHTAEEFPVDKWQEYASPCWMDIRQTNTLNGRLAREADDEKHICPLQLDLIHRCVDLWSAKGDVVFSPFAGIGSEGFVALQNERRFVGVELKESYFKIAGQNLDMAKKIKADYKNFSNIKSSIPKASYGNKKMSDY